MNHRWIVYPSIALAAVAQTPAVSEAEKALRPRVEEFFQYQLEGKYRQAEALVAEESKDEYYAARKPPIEGFKISKVEFLDANRARVTVLSKAKVAIMGAAPQVFEVPSVSSWKLDGGKWCWYIDQELARQTPFGTFKPGKAADTSDPSALFKGVNGAAPSIETLQKSVSIQPDSVELVPGGPAKTVVVTNDLPGNVTVRVADRATPIAGLVVDKKSIVLATKQKGEFSMRAQEGSKFNEAVTFLVEPFNRTVTVQVKTPAAK